MRKISILLTVTILQLTASSFAGDAEYAKFEVFGGYSFVRSMGWGIDGVGCLPGASCRHGYVLYKGWGVVGTDGKSMNGWNVAFTGNINISTGIVFRFGK